MSTTALVLLWCQCAMLLLRWLKVYIIMIVSICGLCLSELELFFIYFLISAVCGIGWSRLCIIYSHWASFFNRKQPMLESLCVTEHIPPTSPDYILHNYFVTDFRKCVLTQT